MSSPLHVPVLLEDVLAHVRDIAIEGGIFLDGTFGRGGHTREILAARPDVKVLALDCDAEAVAFGRENFAAEIAAGRLDLQRGNFSEFQKFLSADRPFAGALLDLGVSSPQLDQGHRGFSFYHDGPLDMRMDHTEATTAALIVNTWTETDLNDLFFKWGEVRSPFRVTKKILEARKEKPFSTTGELSRLIELTEGWRQKGHHPATNYFLALRLMVNQELTRIEGVLEPLVRAIAPKGRALIITFHSLEDRIVKNEFKKLADAGEGFAVNKKVIQAEWSEKKSNPRARSAKLRVFERGLAEVSSGEDRHAWKKKNRGKG